MVLGLRPSGYTSSRKCWDPFLVDEHVKSPFPPSLRRVDWLQGKVSGVAAHLDLQASNWIGSAASVVGPDHENRLPEGPAGRNSQVALAQNHKAGNVHNAIRGEIMDLHPVSKHQTTNEVVEGKRKTPR